MEEQPYNSENLDNSKNSGSDGVYMPLSHDWNKERLETLKKLFPDLFTVEGKLNIDELKKLADPQSVSETERYEFRWFGKSQAKRNAFTPANATLVYDEHRSVNPTASENLIIEGENLEVLKLLSGSYREAIKCIYIDPPYNTGNDFVYSDNYNEDKKPYWEQTGVTENGVKIDTNTETDGRYHSNWLNMMYSRLLIARALLKPDGVIFISIDDNEVHHLRKLCDEVFGEENFMGSVIWKKKTNGNNMGLIPPVHDYILLYAKSFESLDESQFGFPIDEDYIRKNYSNPDNSEKGLWTTMDLSANHKGPHFPIKNPVTGEEFYPSEGRYWVFNEAEVLKRIKDGRIIFGKNGNSRPVQKVYLADRDQKRFKAESWWDKHGMNEDGTEELKNIFGIAKIFDHSKPTKLLKSIINISTQNDDLILDFFSGTGTLGNAVMEINLQDGGNRRFILIQLPERTENKSEAYKEGYKKISDLTIERNKRFIERIIQEKKNKQPDLFTNGNKQNEINGLGFKVFSLVKSNFPRVDYAPDPEKTDEENIAALKKYIADKEAQLVTAFNRDELLTEILLKNNFRLNYTTQKQGAFAKNEVLFVTDGIKETLICLDIWLDMETVNYFKTHTDKKFLCLERALDTTRKWNLKHYLKDKLVTF